MYPNTVDEPFTMIAKSLLYALSFDFNTNPKVVAVYLNMKLASRGGRHFTFPHSAYKDWCSKDGFIKSVRALEESGYIRVVEHNKSPRKPNKYEFVSDWTKRLRFP